MSELKPYPQYKDSGIEWLGEVPEHWEPKKVKFVATINDEVLPESTDEERLIEYIEISDVDSVRGVTATQKIAFGSAPSRARRIVRDKDILVSTVRTYLRAIAPIASPPNNLIASTGFAVIRPQKIDGGYLGYAILCEWFISEIIARSVGVSYPAINASEVAQLHVPLPTNKEQTQIAAFLDHETGKIDALIEEQERLIQLLQEKRQAVISHAVTKGLDPNVPMKDSGVEWLGEVPEHWKNYKIAHSFSYVGGGTTPTSSEEKWYEDGTIPWVTTGELRENVITGTQKHVTEAALKRFSSLKVHPKGSLLIALYGATIGRLGLLGIEATSNQACCVLAKPKFHTIEFVYYWLQAFKDNIIAIYSSGGGQPNISQDVVISLRVPAPTIEEQALITSYLIQELSKMDSLIKESLGTIELLKERRSALISAAVTGKIDVRDWQAPTEQVAS